MNNSEVFKIGEKFSSVVDHYGTTVRTYHIADIYRTYNNNKELVDVKYKLVTDQEPNRDIDMVRHKNLLAHYNHVQKNKKR